VFFRVSGQEKLAICATVVPKWESLCRGWRASVMAIVESGDGAACVACGGGHQGSADPTVGKSFRERVRNAIDC
jgi:hypothetical protein